jgi:hypothetical protein
MHASFSGEPRRGFLGERRNSPGSLADDVERGANDGVGVDAVVAVDLWE